MRLLVSGAAGFVGSELLRLVSDDPEVDVIALARAGSSPPECGGRVTWLEVDLADPGFARALPGELDAVVHLAQSRGYRDFPDRAPEVVDVNLGSTARLLDHARSAGAGRFVLASTATVYRPSADPLAEDSELDHGSLYAASKRGAELLLGPYADLLSCWGMRIFTAYGAEQRGMLIADLIDRVRGGRAVELQGEDGIPMSPIHVSDVARALWAATTVDPVGPGVQLLNVGGAEALGLREIAVRIGEAAGKEPRFERTGDESPPGWIAERSRFERAFPRLDAPLGFARGIERTIGEQATVPADS